MITFGLLNSEALTIQVELDLLIVKKGSLNYRKAADLGSFVLLKGCSNNRVVAFARLIGITCLLL